jgi:hypothetical protein
MKDKPSKAEKRVQRQIEKAQSAKGKSVKFPSGEGSLGAKTVRIAPIPDIVLKNVQYQKQADTEKVVYIPNESAFSTACNLTWCKTKADRAGAWSWKEQRAWTEKEWETQILPNFKDLEKLAWSEILFEQKTSAKGQKRVPKHHKQEISSLVKEAQDRWIEIGLEQYDTVFRFRFGGTTRAWGVKLQGHFYLIWWERYHNIYPTKKR